MVICLERGADLHMAQLMSLLLTVPCFSKIQIGFTFLVPAHLGSPGQRAVKRACVFMGSISALTYYLVLIIMRGQRQKRSPPARALLVSGAVDERDADGGGGQLVVV